MTAQNETATRQQAAVDALSQIAGARHARQGYIDIVSRDSARRQPSVGQTVMFSWAAGEEPLLDERIDTLVDYSETAGGRRRARMTVIASKAFRLDDQQVQVLDDEEMGWTVHVQPASRTDA